MPKEIKDKTKGLPEKMLKWRAKQKIGAIMKPETFEKIKKEAAKKKDKVKDPEAVAGAVYWKTVGAKYREAQKHKGK